VDERDASVGLRTLRDHGLRCLARAWLAEMRRALLSAEAEPAAAERHDVRPRFSYSRSSVMIWKAALSLTLPVKEEAA